jgi:uncharacterized protein YcaQ
MQAYAMGERMRRLTQEQARRAALGAQGFYRPAPSGRRDRRHFRRVFDDIGLLQLDSVNVLERSHYLPVFARLGRYGKAQLDNYTVDSGEVFEYWGHEASLLPVELYPYLRHRMAGHRPWQRVRALLEDHPGYVESVYAELVERGPLTVGDLADPGSRKGNWWGWGNGKVALEWLFGCGRITAYRTANFTRVYDLPERVIAAEHLEAEPLPEPDAYRHLLALAARHHAVGTAADLADYYRLHLPTARPILAAMADRGDLIEVDVPGWKGPVYADPDMSLPRREPRSALLSPFDPVVWARDRAERLFDFHYRIEIYVPAPKRIYGYYVLPYLLDGELVARVDLKADRKAGALRVLGAYAENGRDKKRVGRALRQDLEALAGWLGLSGIVEPRKGDLTI